jgi:hypothetical protein
MTGIAIVRLVGSRDPDRSPEYDRRSLPPVLVTLIALAGCVATILSLTAMG